MKSYKFLSVFLVLVLCFVAVGGCKYVAPNTSKALTEKEQSKTLEAQNGLLNEQNNLLRQQNDHLRSIADSLKRIASK